MRSPFKPKEARYVLRWRFDYHDKPSAKGMWSKTTNNPVDQAWNKNNNPSRVKIEAKDLDTKQVRVLVDCIGEDFRNFAWLAAGRIGGGFIHGSVVPFTQLVGLEMWTRNKRIQVYNTGEILVKELTESDKNMNLATYGK